MPLIIVPVYFSTLDQYWSHWSRCRISQQHVVVVSGSGSGRGCLVSRAFGLQRRIDNSTMEQLTLWHASFLTLPLINIYTSLTLPQCGNASYVKVSYWDGSLDGTQIKTVERYIMKQTQLSAYCRWVYAVECGKSLVPKRSGSGWLIVVSRPRLLSRWHWRPRPLSRSLTWRQGRRAGSSPAPDDRLWLWRFHGCITSPAAL